MGAGVRQDDRMQTNSVERALEIEVQPNFADYLAP